ncbi:hypothetical protein AK812_SmicGene9199 [Symbiodinium microadriaticum]|uniref:Uncharacterized protein n=1 Tax=Symbiodinium microadriaticum TaxID=2951 RepID=A0A1Q9EJ92_SYMMI|nr:hypothetical protein AK812_SmicGene9199 [Symbiodinium microadriaticum]CAE7030326.1 unnamed protein product [Symbiodinium sp. KB8]CAE7200671.1 unnamed protein product [Symbiodinium microadriaticum]
MGILLLGWFTKTYCASRKYECGSRNDRPCLRDRQGWEDDEERCNNLPLDFVLDDGVDGLRGEKLQYFVSSVELEEFETLKYTFFTGKCWSKVVKRRDPAGQIGKGARCFCTEHMAGSIDADVLQLMDKAESAPEKERTYNENFLKFEEPIDENEEDTSYDDLRTFLTTCENAKRCTQPTTADLINSGKDHGGQTAMDVSQEKEKETQEAGPKAEGKEKRMVEEEEEEDMETVEEQRRRNQNTTTEDLRSTAPHDSEEETNYEMNYVNNIVMVQMKDNVSMYFSAMYFSTWKSHKDQAKGTDHNVEFEVFTDDNWSSREPGIECQCSQVCCGLVRQSFGCVNHYHHQTRNEQEEMKAWRLMKKQIHQDHSAQDKEEAEAEQEDEEPAAPQDRTEVAGSLPVAQEGWVYSLDITLKDLRDLCKELGVSLKGIKKDLLRRLSKATRAD